MRFEYPGAIYHVINRGNYREWVFREEGAKKSFEKALFEACEEHGWILRAYCVMGNHFHLALETPEGNLSKGMAWLQSTFAMRYNRYRRENGHIFQGRSKSIVVEDKKLETAQRIIDGDAGREAKEQLWEKALANCLRSLRKEEGDIESDPKCADWKVAVCAFLRQRFHCQSRWISERLNMGTEAGVSRGLRRLREGASPEAAKVLSKLKSTFKS